jgi:hypothetical protein
MRTVATGAITCLLGVALVPLGLAVAYESIELGYIRYGVPAAGFFPFWAGLALAAAGALLVAVSWPERRARQEIFWPQQLIWLGATLVLLLATEWLGLLLSGFLFLVLTIRLLGKLPLWIGLLTGTLACGLLWLAFEVWLLVPLPAGLFERF